MTFWVGNDNHYKNHIMKKLIVPTAVGFAGILLLSGCVAAIGNRDGRHSGNATIGQQLIDLQKAKDAGAISQAEYDKEKARLLE